MEDKQKEEEKINSNQYIQLNINYLFYNKENLVNKNEDLICPICMYVLKNTISCSDNKTSHSFCKNCIDLYLKEKNKCPICKNNFEYKVKNDIINSLEKLFFKCLFKNEGCKEIISYKEYFNHLGNCKYNNIKYECYIKKYNYIKK